MDGVEHAVNEIEKETFMTDHWNNHIIVNNAKLINVIQHIPFKKSSE